MSEIRFNWQILGHKKIKEHLQKSIALETLAHAYIFEGGEHLGKTLTAKLFANSILCEKKSEVVPCGQCSACRQFEKNIHPDVNYLEREINEKSGVKKSVIGVAQIRAIQEKINRHSFGNSYKIVIIPEAQFLNVEASNSLLKTLEEPSDRTIIILITNDLEALLPTVRSRSRIVKFLPVSRGDIYDYILEKGASRSDAKDLSSQSSGKPTQALKFQANPADFSEFKQRQRGILNFWSRENAAERFKTVETWLQDSEDDNTIDLLNNISLVGRDLLLVNVYCENDIVNEFMRDDLLNAAKKYTPMKLKKILEEIEQTKRYIRQNINPRLALENLVLGME